MTPWILLIAFVLVIVILVIRILPDEVQISSYAIKLGKLLKIEILFSNIEGVRLNPQYPRTIRRVNGFDSGDVKKGIFEAPDGRMIRLFIYQEYPPFIEIIHKNGLLVFNSSNPDNTTQQYNEIKSKLEKS